MYTLIDKNAAKLNNDELIVYTRALLECSHKHRTVRGIKVPPRSCLLCAEQIADWLDYTGANPSRRIKPILSALNNSRLIKYKAITRKGYLVTPVILEQKFSDAKQPGKAKPAESRVIIRDGVAHIVKEDLK